jgi:hypothetical protein
VLVNVVVEDNVRLLVIVVEVPKLIILDVFIVSVVMNVSVTVYSFIGSSGR